MNNKTDNFFLIGTIDRVEGDLAVIKLDDGQIINWPAKNLPSQVKEGSVVRIRVMTATNEEAERTQLAKTLLNEIFKNSQ